MPSGSFLRRASTVLITLLAIGLCARVAHAAPIAHVLRVDPRTSVKDGSPIVTLVVDLTEPRRVSEVVAHCAPLRDGARHDCMSAALEQPGALGRPFPFPAKSVELAVRVGDQDVPATYVGHTRFGDSQQEPGVGTAWLIVVDAGARMGTAYEDAAAVAQRFVEAQAPNDLMNIVLVGDDQILADTSWLDVAHRDAATAALKAQGGTTRPQGRTRPLLSLLKRTASDAFRSLGSSGDAPPPLHQAMVVISSGYGGGDPSTTGPGAAQLSEYLTRGRMADDNTAVPKLPIPVVSIFVPPDALPEHQQLAADFMQNLANPSIGGFFTVLRDGQAEHAGRIVDTVRRRFSDMVLARFRLSCVAPAVTQSFSLLFPGSVPAVVGDSSFRDVPIGIEPAGWPLDVDLELTRKQAKDKQGIFPGGRLRVFGNFCWGGDATRPEVYFLPPGEKLPQALGSSPEAAREVQKRLTALDMRGRVLQASDSFVEFQVPDSEQILHGEGESAVVRLVVVDSTLHRTTGLTEATVMQLAGAKRPLPVLWIGATAGAFGLVLLATFFMFKSARSRLPSATSSLPLRRLSRSPYMTPSPVSRGPKSEGGAGTRATLEGPAGRFILLAGTDLKVGRDGTRCAAVIQNPKVSGIHATFRFEQGKLLVRDEGSTVGTRVDGSTVTAGEWVELAHDDEVFLGPERLKVSMSRT